MAWLDYEKATPEQQSDFRRANPQLKNFPWAIYQIWITASGRASRRKGHWQWTEKYAKTASEACRRAMRGDDVRSRGDLRDFKVGDLHIDRSST